MFINEIHKTLALKNRTGFDSLLIHMKHMYPTTPNQSRSQTIHTYSFITTKIHQMNVVNRKLMHIIWWYLQIWTFCDWSMLLTVAYWCNMTHINIDSCNGLSPLYRFRVFCLKYLQKITNHKSKISLEFKFRITFHRISRWLSLSKCLSAYQRLSYD